ncbi:hypothetical protein GCM10011415_22620 [Salipiger pallidus]|uniref:Transposase n=1 Tax=Salipiger pallidus TaxID=1775170 RepID=A0A8J2ZK05_9RHOB|nr:hypothetical protein GCM10011415_22620 [Salipiger pallidus]
MPDPQKASIVKQGKKGTPVAEICRKAAMSQTTHPSRKKTYADLLPTDMTRLKQLKDENSRLKKIMAALTLGSGMLQDVIRRKISGLVGWASVFAGCAATRNVDPDGLAPPGLTAQRSTSNPAAPTRPPWRSGSGRFVRHGFVAAIARFTYVWTVRAGASTSRKSVTPSGSWE